MDKLKDLWKKEEEELQGSESLTLKIDTATNIVEKIHRTLKKENYIHIAAAIFTIIWFAIGDNNLIFGGLILFLLAPVIGYYFYVISKVKPDSFSSDVRSHLIYVHKLYKSFVNRYRVLGYLYTLIGIFLVPVMIFLTSFSESPYTSWWFWLLLFAVAAFIITISEGYIYFFHKKKITYLESLIKNLEKNL